MSTVKNLSDKVKRPYFQKSPQHTRLVTLVCILDSHIVYVPPGEPAREGG